MRPAGRFGLAVGIVLGWDVVWPALYRGLPGSRWWTAHVFTAVAVAIPLWMGALCARHGAVGAAVAWTAGLGAVDATLGWAVSLFILPGAVALDRSPPSTIEVAATVVGVVALYGIAGFIGAVAARRVLRAT